MGARRCACVGQAASCRGRVVAVCMTPTDPSRTLARQVRVAGIAWCERVRTCRATSFGRGVQAPPSVDRRGNPARPEITSQLAAPTGRLTVFCARHAFTPSHPSVGTARKDEGGKPRAFNQVATRPPGRWSDADRAAPAPRSKPIAHASRLVTHCAPSVASGRGVKIRAAGPAHLRLYSQLSICVRGPQKVWRTFRGDRRTPCSPTAPTPTEPLRYRPRGSVRLECGVAVTLTGESMV